MANLTALRQARGMIKARVTRFSKWLDTFNPLTGDFGNLESRLDEALAIMPDFNECQRQIEVADEVSNHEEDRMNFEEYYHSTIGRAKMFLRRHTNATPSSTYINNTVSNPGIKLPTMSLPTFDGSYDHWLNFRDTFRALVHDNASISDIQKFYYLRSSVSDTAAEVINSVTASAENYQIAWEMLTKRFDNKKLMISRQLQSLIDTPLLQRESGPALRQMLDHVQKISRSLKILKANTWDAVFTHQISSKMDNATKREWKSFTKDLDAPTEKDLVTFLEERCSIVDTEVITKPASKSNSSGDSRRSGTKRYNQSLTCVSTDPPTCKVCENSHEVYKCPVFRNLAVASRTNEVKKHKLCINCLRSHSGKCTFGRCRQCKKFHNSLLHVDNNPTNASVSEFSAVSPAPEQSQSAKGSNQRIGPTDGPSTSQVAAPFTGAVGATKSQVLLSTALILVEDRYGKPHQCRALLDSGSQSNLLTKEFSKRLSLPKERLNMPLGGINNTFTNVRERLKLTIRSRQQAYKSTLPVLVIDEIVTQHPTTWIDAEQLRIPENLTLADPTFNRPGRIDLLLGASIFWELLCAGQIKLKGGQPIMQKTQLGWIISGEVAVNRQPRSQQFCGLVHDEQIQNNLERFWKLEECIDKPHFTKEEQACEEHFVQTYSHEDNAKFVVQLPLRNDVSHLGDSKQAAIKRFHAVERKLLRQPDLKAQYVKFMDEYESLNHMTEVSDNLPVTQQGYYIPHHAVLKEDSLTTKLRVVFDGSCKTTSGTSLNTLLLVGPTIQQDLFSIVLRFRQHKYVITADIEKMYRQILVHKDQRDLQRIIWRRSPEEPLRIFQLNTVTYGLASSPFLAIRCLHQLAHENREHLPDASRVIEEDFYVDDLITGADTLEEINRIRIEVIKILGTAKFNLYKWAANDEALLDNIGDDTTTATRSIGDDVKTLGLRWNPLRDELQYHVKGSSTDSRVTKRTILSATAQIFDPLGLIGPTTIKAKIILQRLWSLKISWDESVPLDLHTMWIQYAGHLQSLQHIRIPRLIKITNPGEIELHGFCDASEAAYGACLYIRSSTPNGTWTSRLLCAKSKVAPIKNVSLPRLELCGALLLARLSRKATRALRMHIDQVYFWSDSTITLAWIKGEPRQWKTFVANRVSEIQGLTNPDTWRHVKSEDNPADVISRGIDPQLLEGTTLWWQGPTWLSERSDHWPQSPLSQPGDLPETRQHSVVLVNINKDCNELFFNRFSSLSRLTRVAAYCLRFKRNTLNRGDRQNGPLTVNEINIAFSLLIKLMQEQEFPHELQNLKLRQNINNHSKLLSLHPFLDEDGILRVGGRLGHSSLPETQKHSIILPAKHRLTQLIIRDEHYRLLHAGAQALLASLRTRFWPLSGRNAVRSVLRHCIICFKTRPNSVNQLMGNLPGARVNPSRAFLKCGVDYAGPFSIKISRNKTGKAYLCLFVCLSTKAVHLEVASDLSTTGFLQAFKRFIARRGKPSDMYSDNGTNFVGANNELKELYNLIQDEQHRSAVANFSTQQLMNWHFNPPNSPHFGGLWEAGVKSVKTHLRKIVGNALLTFEELYTTFSTIEACLNSRPLSPISDDPNDLTPLTPGHFLIGEPLTALPQPDLLDVPLNRLTRYQRISQLKQHFWSRWSREYLSNLQQRRKWTQIQNTNYLPGAMVILKDDNVPAMQWRMGRIVEVHPGKDGHTRVVSVKTRNGIIKRALAKVCVLPLEEYEKTVNV